MFGFVPVCTISGLSGIWVVVLPMGCETMACGLNPAHCLFSKIKFYWNAAMPICLCIFCGCFHTIIVIVKQLQQRLLGPQNLKFTIWYFIEKVC